MKYHILLFMSIVMFGIIPFSNTAYGQTDKPVTGEYTVLAPLPGTTKQCTGSGADQTCTADINSYLEGFLGLVIGIGAVIAMIMLGFYGFQYATSDSASVKMENKGKLWEIVQGLLLIISAYAIIYTINPNLLKFELDISAPVFNGGSVNIVVGGGPSTPYDIAGFDIGRYATAINHEQVVQNVFNQLSTTLGQNPSADLITNTIKKIRPNTPITGAMILNSARKYNVNPILIMSLIQVDSSYGTAGLGKDTNNPGNVGNMDDGSIRRFNSWQEGVDAVGEWLNRNRTK